MGEQNHERVKSHGWQEMIMPGDDRVRSATELSALTALRQSGTKMFTKGACRVLLSHEPKFEGDGLRWHLSISCADRYPTWEEIKDARYSLLPLGLTFAQILPPMNEFVNIHPNCFHLWEIDWKG